VALTDSPSGLLVYILEKFSSWTRRDHKLKADGGLAFRFSKDQLIDNLMMYWIPNSITTSMRFYAENMSRHFLAFELPRVFVEDVFKAVKAFREWHQQQAMAKFILVAGLVVLVTFPFYYLFLKSPPPLPELDANAWWGPNELKGNQDKTVKPFTVSFSKELVRELEDRLKRPRSFNPPLEGVGFEYGFNSAQLKSWLDYWVNDYPFAAREKFLNQFPQFKTNIQGLDIHFIRVTPKVPAGVETVPLLLLHGWPGSVREFYEAIPLLTAAAVRPGLGANEVAVVFRNLMHRLGFNKFYVQGGDWGSEFRQKADGGLSFRFTKEQLIDNLMMYWSSKSITTSMRLYAESFNIRHLSAQIDDLVNVTVLNDGGHFLAFELPKEFSEDVLKAVTTFRKLAKSAAKTEL
ncbi:Juvenile hormone epoxide hydrolase, partial [Operophtera brumata]